MKKFLLLLLLLLSSCSFTSCARTRYIPLPESHSRDSLSAVVHKKVNNTYIDRTHTLTQRGDTIFKTDSIYVEKYTDVEVHDTITLTRTDTITIPVPVEPSIDHSPRRRFLALSERARVLGKGCLIGGIGAFLLLIFLRIYLHR